ncbi:MAG: dihydrolipoamide acetyltransferase family protein [Bacillota bacterium]
MATNVMMPKLGLSMEEGTIDAWLVSEGSPVKKGQDIAEISSEKLTNTVTAPEDGVLAKIVVKQEDTVPVGALIAIIAASGEAVSAPGEAAAATSAVKQDAPAPAAQAVAPAAIAAEVRITPRAKKIAEEKGLAYAHIKGTGIGGAITIDDLRRFGKPIAAALAVSPAAAPAAPAAQPVASAAQPVAVTAPATAPVLGVDSLMKLTNMRQAIAKAMQRSLLDSAQTTLMTDANVKNLSALYQSLKGKYTAAGIKLSYTAMLVKAVAMALESHPKLRTQYADDKHAVTKGSIDIGIAVDVPDGLVVPVLRQANLKDLRTICLELADLANRARDGKLTDADFGNGALTITNLGMFGITHFTPVLNAPETAILGVGAIVDTPVVRDGGIHIEPVLSLSLTHDHRLIDGAPAARFLQELVASLQKFSWY